jgi:DNA-binding FadR family transcriptional regulator
MAVTHTRAEALAAELERTIDERGLQPGDSLGTLKTLQDDSGYARATVSEAVRLLRDRGSIEIRPGRHGGLFVASVTPVVRLRHTLLSVRGQATTVADAIVVRDALESSIDLDAARHCKPVDRAALRDALTEMRRSAHSADAYMRANWALHERIAEITPNGLLKAVYLGTIRCIADMSVRADSDDPSHEKDYRAERVKIHAELIKAIISGDAERTAQAVELHAGARPTN